MRERKIYSELLKRAKETRSKGNWSFDLDMKNGQELRIYLEGEPVTRNYNSKDFSILTDDNNVIHFNSLADIANFIDSNF